MPPMPRRWTGVAPLVVPAPGRRLDGDAGQAAAAVASRYVLSIWGNGPLKYRGVRQSGPRQAAQGPTTYRGRGMWNLFGVLRTDHERAKPGNASWDFSSFLHCRFLPFRL